MLSVCTYAIRDDANTKQGERIGASGCLDAAAVQKKLAGDLDAFSKHGAG
jgi:hypothetical protein